MQMIFLILAFISLFVGNAISEIVWLQITSDKEITQIDKWSCLVVMTLYLIALPALLFAGAIFYENIMEKCNCSAATSSCEQSMSPEE